MKFRREPNRRRQGNDISFSSLQAGEFENMICFVKYSNFTVLKWPLLISRNIKLIIFWRNLDISNEWEGGGGEGGGGSPEPPSFLIL